MINYELAYVAQQELGLYHITGERQMRQITAIFRAWVSKHSEDIEKLSEYFYSKKNNTQTFRDVLYGLFMSESRDHDNHKWLTDNLS